MADSEVGTLGTTRLPILTATNYAFWKIKRKVLLMRDALWDIVEQPKPDPTPENWSKSNNKAYGTIALTLSDSQLFHISKCVTAHDVWNSLQRLYERTTFGSKLYLMRKLFSMRYTSGNMREHIDSILEVVQQLGGAGEEVKDGYVVAVLLNSLPDNYMPLVTMLEGRDEEDLTVNYVAGKSEDEYQRRQEAGIDREDSSKALQTSSGSGKNYSVKARGTGKNFKHKEERVCYFCNKKNHIKTECRAYKRWLEQQGNDNNKKGGNKSSSFNQNRKDEKSASARSNDYLFTTCTVSEHVCATNAEMKNRWYVDSGATCHMTNNRDHFLSLRPTDVNIQLADGSVVKATGTGEVVLNCKLPDGKIHKVTAENTLYSPRLEGSLLSVLKMTDHGFKVAFEKGACTIQKGNTTVARAIQDKNLFCLETMERMEMACTVNETASLHDWHRRLGHRNVKAIQQMVTEELATGIHIKECKEEIVCKHCPKGKMAQKPFPTSESRAEETVDLIHSDVCGPMQTITPSGNRYMLTFIDDHSRFTIVKLIKSKDEVTGVFKQFVSFLQNQKGRKPKVLRTDNGKEYMTGELLVYLQDQGIGIN